jgi:hypothetical protein
VVGAFRNARSTIRIGAVIIEYGYCCLHKCFKFILINNLDFLIWCSVCYYLEFLRASEGTLSHWSQHLQSLAPTSPHWAHVVDYGPFSLCVIHKEGLCPSSRDINRLMMMMWCLGQKKYGQQHVTLYTCSSIVALLPLK